MTLHDHIRVVVEERLRLAKAATPAPWEPDGPFLSDVVTSALLGMVADCSVGTGYRPQSLDDARHIAANDPTDAILSAEHALGILERHRAETFAGSSLPEHLDLDPDEPWCRVCRGSGWPCPDIRALATRWRVEVDG